MLTNFLRLLAFISLIVAIFWVFNDRTYEPILALLGAIAFFATSFFTDKQAKRNGSVSVKDVESGKNLTIENKKEGDLDVKRAKSAEDMTITNS